MKRLLIAVAFLLASLVPARSAAPTFSVAAFNVENYLDVPSGTMNVKSTEAKAKVRECIRTLHPDILALEEMGSTNALLELRGSLAAEGLDYPYWEHITGFDTNIHVAVLTKFPITARRPHTNDNYLLSGRRFYVSRGFIELDIQVTPAYRITLMTAHLKSQRPIGEADEAEMREQEAILLRQHISQRLKIDPTANLVVVGDFNDGRDSRSTKAIIGRGNNGLIDTRPAENNGDQERKSPIAAYASRTVAWTYYYGKNETYSRIDYILVSKSMAPHWLPGRTYVLATPDWGVASDHRPILATFQVPETKSSGGQ
jgi:endonuclease/exonuclease/phosphatase family metal-dependent hydrolase